MRCCRLLTAIKKCLSKDSSKGLSKDYGSNKRQSKSWNKDYVLSKGLSKGFN